MCNSVLNDEWVSHPSWVSEDSGFVAHKKNVFEEALHKSEEERHEYDFYIEAMMKTITVLEPIHSKIMQLSEAERSTFKLKPNWNGQLKSIHQRLLKKIYGREAGLEVVQALQDSPVLAIPVVVQRLKQKEEEWKRAQREWNKVWREVDARNYWKSLDHQGVTFKANDKKAITTKAFVNHIELAREEQLAKRASLIDPSFARTRPRYQLAFTIDDVSVLQDSLKLVLSFLDRTQGQISANDRKKIENLLRHFVPLFFMFYQREFDSAFSLNSDSADSDVIMSDGMASILGDDDSGSVAGSTRSKNGKKAANGGDIRKKLLKATQQQERQGNRRTRSVASTPGSRAPSPPPSNANGMDIDIPGPSRATNGNSLANGSRKGAAKSNTASKSYQSTSNSTRKYHSQRGSFFANTTLYVLLRLLYVSLAIKVYLVDHS
jgi:paired amphipathic helix protein Sin3a